MDRGAAKTTGERTRGRGGRAAAAGARELGSRSAFGRFRLNEKNRGSIVVVGVQLDHPVADHVAATIRLVATPGAAGPLSSLLFGNSLSTTVTLFDEWSCLHCGASHLDALTHCPRCGATRAWLIG